MSKLRLIDQLRSDVYHFTGENGLALGLISFLVFFIRAKEQMLAPMSVVNVSVGRFHISCNERFLLTNCF